ncbi:MAG: ATP-binding protein [Chloroflexi bacterium]|nr:ATP-binding protein [Chloroflexota bacterium]
MSQILSPPPPEPFTIERYVEDHRADDIEPIIAEKIRAWEQNTLSAPFDRIIPVAGSPGIGKTWLLRYLSHTHQGIYIDLEERHQFATSPAYINHVHEQIHSTPDRQRRGYLLLIDHVPALRNEELLLDFEDRVLRSHIRGHSLVIMAQQHPLRWCWSGDIPHPIPLILHGFTEAGWKRQVKQLAASLLPKIKKLLDGTEHSPYLITLLCRNNGDIGSAVEQFLTYWATRVGYPIAQGEVQRELSLASTLACMADPEDDEQLSTVLDQIGCKESPFYIRLRMLLRRWWAREPGKSGYVWSEPARHALRAWLRAEKPGLYQQLGCGRSL